MRDLLQDIDLDYYRSALLEIARAEIERLRKELLRGADTEKAGADLKRHGQSPGGSPSAGDANSPETIGAGPPSEGRGAVRRE